MLRKRILKLISIINSFVILLFLSCNNDSAKNVYYYLPKNVNKPFAIVFQNKTKKSSSKLNNTYKIPQNRVLEADFSDEPNISKAKIYYIDNNNDTIKRVRNYHFDVYNKIPIKKGDVYELNTYYKKISNSSKTLQIQVVIITDDLSEIGKANAMKTAVDLEKYIIERYDGK